MRTTDSLDRREPPTNEQPAAVLDDRGVSEVLGAILIFALVVLLIALIQVNAVPAANQQVEFEHNQRVQGDLQEFQEVLLRSVSENTEGSVAIEAGTGYPSRFFLFNPPRASGTVALTDGGTVTIDNAVGTGEARDYLDGSTISIPSRTLAYTPNYNEYRNAPTTLYENGVLYNEFPTEQRVVSERRSFVSGQTISLVALQGDYSTGTSSSLSLGMTPISAPAQAVRVTTETGSTTDDPLVITVPTRLTASEWRDVLSDDLESNGGSVQSISDPDPSDGQVTFEFVPGEAYDLRMAAVGIGGGFDAETDAEYIVDVSGSGETVPENGSQRLLAQVRDGYNNPVSGVTVSNTTNLADARVRPVSGNQTGTDGRVAFEYDAPSDVNGLQDATVTLSFGGNTTERQRVRFDLSVFDTDGSGSADPSTGGNPINPANVVVSEAALVGGQCNNRNDGCVVDITMENRDGANAKEIEQMRFSFYSTDDDYFAPTSVEVRDEPQDGGAITTLTIPDTFRNVALDDLEEAGSAGDTQEYRLSFKDFERRSPGGGGSQFVDGAVSGDFFILEVRFEDEGTTRDNYVTYFVGAT